MAKLAIIVPQRMFQLPLSLVFIDVAMESMTILQERVPTKKVLGFMWLEMSRVRIPILMLIF